MATGGKIRVKNLKQVLDKLVDKTQKDPKNKPMLKDVRFMKTCSDIKELLKQELPEEEIIRKGQTIFHRAKEGKEGPYPPEFLIELENTFFVRENTEKKEKEDAKVPVSKPRTPDTGREDNQSVNAGPAPAPVHSTHSPKSVHKRTIDVNIPGGNQDTERLQKEITKLKHDLDEKCKELDGIKHKFDDREIHLKELETEVKTKAITIKELNEESADLAKSLEEEKLNVSYVKNESDRRQKMIEKLEAAVNEYSSKEVAYKNQFEEMTAYSKKLEKEMSKSEQYRQKDKEYFQDQLKEHARKHDDQYKKLMAERDDLRDRFSKLAGAKLQEKNADIADLSDPNRAMKLSEKFGQIYDDEWTNAFEVLTDKKAGFQLKDAITFLLRLLQECWSYCTNLMDAQMESVHSMFLQPAQNLATYDKKKMGKTDRPRISSKDNQTLYDLRRRIGVLPAIVEEVKQALLSQSKTWDKQRIGHDTKYVDACAPYIQKCAEICWLMALHDPPLYMKKEVKPGEKLDMNIYSVYSSSGNSIDFLVWPPLYNGKDGGLLAKGVVEPQKTIGKKK